MPDCLRRKEIWRSVTIRLVFNPRGGTAYFDWIDLAIIQKNWRSKNSELTFMIPGCCFWRDTCMGDGHSPSIRQNTQTCFIQINVLYKGVDLRFCTPGIQMICAQSFPEASCHFLISTSSGFGTLTVSADLFYTVGALFCIPYGEYHIFMVHIKMHPVN